MLPVGGLLFVGAGLLGVGTIKDLALILFVGLASGAYSSLFLATPIVVELTERDAQYKALSDTPAFAQQVLDGLITMKLVQHEAMARNITVTGEINLANAADCAENFDISAESCAEPGTVMALDEQGTLQESFRPYDKRVAGVISGAGNYKPGLVLDKQQSPCNRKPIALLGKVFCKVDAQFGPIEVGDLLTTSPTQGHAMRVADPLRAFGAVIGKALRPLAGGQGLIPILIALQ